MEGAREQQESEEAQPAVDEEASGDRRAEDRVDATGEHLDETGSHQRTDVVGEDQAAERRREALAGEVVLVRVGAACAVEVVRDVVADQRAHEPEHDPGHHDVREPWIVLRAGDPERDGDGQPDEDRGNGEGLEELAVVRQDRADEQHEVRRAAHAVDRQHPDGNARRRGGDGAGAR
jgi:hypothetical protein